MPHPSLIDDLHWRYATKHFDPKKTIPTETWRELEKSVILTPSSYGLQPWKFIVVTDPKVKEQLRPHAWNQAQVTDCSHFVIFASKTTIDSEYIDGFLALAAQARGVAVESMKGYRDMIVKNLVHDAHSGSIVEWAGRQAYIALGQFMLAAALLRVDACPMEGFVPAEFDKILGLTAKGLAATVCCAVGYRSDSDKYSAGSKVRFPARRLVEYV